MNPWITPMWVLLGVSFVLNALMFITINTSAFWPVTGIWLGVVVFWTVVTVQANRWNKY